MAYFDQNMADRGQDTPLLWRDIQDISKRTVPGQYPQQQQQQQQPTPQPLGNEAKTWNDILSLANKPRMEFNGDHLTTRQFNPVVPGGGTQMIYSETNQPMDAMSMARQMAGANGIARDYLPTAQKFLDERLRSFTGMQNADTQRILGQAQEDRLRQQMFGELGLRQQAQDLAKQKAEYEMADRSKMWVNVYQKAREKGLSHQEASIEATSAAQDMPKSLFPEAGMPGPVGQPMMSPAPTAGSAGATAARQTSTPQGGLGDPMLNQARSYLANQKKNPEKAIGLLMQTHGAEWIKKNADELKKAIADLNPDALTSLKSTVTPWGITAGGLPAKHQLTAEETGDPAILARNNLIRQVILGISPVTQQPFKATGPSRRITPAFGY